MNDPEIPRYNPDTFERWVADGVMTPDNVLKRVSSEMRDHPACIKSDDLAELSENFENISDEDASGIKRVNEDGFVSFLEGTGALPPAFKEVGPMLYRCVLYLSQFPFQHSSSLPSSMTLEDLSRALVWIRPEGCNGGRGGIIYKEGSDCRGMMPADYRRIIFQSLATARGGEQLKFDTQKAREQAHQRAFEVTPEYLPPLSLFGLEFCMVNYDEDGDQMFHDMLDIMYSTQPCRLPVGSYPRNMFRPLARELLGNDIRLHDLSIPRSNFHSLVKFLLATSFNEKTTAAREENAGQREYVTDLILKTFSQNLDENIGITWQAFDEALADTATALFFPLFDTLERFFTAQNLTKNTLPKELSTIMTVPIVEQLGTFLLYSVAFEDLQLYKAYQPGNQIEEGTNAVELEKDIKCYSKAAILLISGRVTGTGASSLFGAYIPLPQEDGASIQPPEDGDNWDRCMLFELSPAHDVFPGRVGQPGWKVSPSNGLCFGDSSNGASLSLSSDLQRAILGQIVAGEGDIPSNSNATRGRPRWKIVADNEDRPSYFSTTQTRGNWTVLEDEEDDPPNYYGTQWRGNWKIEVDVSTIELWSYSPELD